MERHGEQVDVTTDEARAGSTSNVVRYILLIGIFLVVAAFTIIVVTGALSQDGPGEATRQVERPRPAASPTSESAEIMSDNLTLEARDDAERRVNPLAPPAE